MASQPEHLDPPAHSVTEPQRSRPTAYIHSAGMKTRLFVVTTANIMGRIFPLLPFLSIPSAVVNALKSLQQKIRQMELEEKETEKNYQQLSHDVTDQKEISPSRSTAHQPGPHGSAREGKGVTWGQGWSPPLFS